MKQKGLEYQAAIEDLILAIAEIIDPILKQNPAQTVIFDLEFYNRTSGVHLNESAVPELAKITSIQELINLQQSFREKIILEICNEIDELKEAHLRLGWKSLPNVPDGYDFDDPFDLHSLTVYDGKDIDINNIDELIDDYFKAVDPKRELTTDRFIVLSALANTAFICNNERENIEAKCGSDSWYLVNEEAKRSSLKRLVKIRASLELLGEEAKKG